MRVFIDEQLGAPGAADTVCAVPLNPYAASAIAAASTLACGLIGAHVGKTHKHPTMGAMAGALIGGAAAGPVIANVLSSKKTAAETQSLPPIDAHGFMTSDPDVCVLPPSVPEAIGMGVAGVIVPGLVGSLFGTTGALIGAALGAAGMAPIISQPPFSERTASDFR
jgi:hypothetical protein